MNTIKWELEDLAFATLYPKMYDEIVRLVAERAPARDEYLSEVIEQVSGDLREAKIKATVTGRPKHYYSIYQKMIVRGRDFADIYDLVGIRVLVDTVRDCYAALGTIHARWNPVPGRFKDYIAMPKFNMYQSLHTTVIGPEGKPVELQIRTYAMHHRAEYGVAAHWKYKEETVRRAGPAPAGTSRQRHGLAAAAPRLAEGDRRPGRVPGVAALRPVGRRRSSSSPPKGDVIALPAGRHPGRLRLRGPHRGRPPLHRRPRQRPAGAAGVARSTTATRSRSSPPRRRTPARPATGWTSSRAPARATRSGTGSPRSAARTAIEQGKDAIGPRDAQAEPAAPAHAVRRGAADARATSCATPTSPRSTRRSARATSRRRPSCRSWCRRWRRGGRRGGHRRDRAPRRRGRAGRGRAGDPGVVVKGATTCGSSCPGAARPCPATTIIGFVTRGHGVSVHRTDCVNVDSLWRSSPTGWSRSSGRPTSPRCSWWPSRSRRSTGPGCCRTSPGCCPTSTSTSSRRPSRPPATGSPLSRFTFEMGDPSTSATS